MLRLAANLFLQQCLENLIDSPSSQLFWFCCKESFRAAEVDEYGFIAWWHDPVIVSICVRCAKVSAGETGAAVSEDGAARKEGEEDHSAIEEECQP
jgi:hypothetical protein